MSNVLTKIERKFYPTLEDHERRNEKASTCEGKSETRQADIVHTGPDRGNLRTACGWKHHRRFV